MPRKPADPNAPARPKREIEYEITMTKGDEEETVTAKTRGEAKAYIKAAKHFGYEVTGVVLVTQLELSTFADDASLRVNLEGSGNEAEATA